MSAVDRLMTKLATQRVSAYVAKRHGKPVPVVAYKRDVFSRIVRDLASQYRARAEQRDVLMTPMMEALARGTGGRLVGTEFRLKGEVRIRAKIEAKLVEENLSEPEKVRVSDALRYTIEYDDLNYTRGALMTLTRLKGFGFQVESKNYWKRGDPYNGTNVALTDPSGFPIELQFHTPGSRKVQEVNHPLYEEFRSIYETERRFDPNDAIRARELWIQMVNNALSSPIPPGVENLPGERFQPYPDLPGLAVSSLFPVRGAAVGLSREGS